jgi:glycine oxidase
MGCATALSLAEAGADDVIVLERAVPGAEASSAAAGILGAQVELGETSRDDAALFRRARARYRDWADVLRDATGIDIGYRKCGALHVAEGDGEGDHLASRVAWQKSVGFVSELVDGRRAREIEPALSPAVTCAAYFVEESQVDPPALLRALIAAVARKQGVEVRSGVTVRSLLVESDRCKGVRLEDGLVQADATVLAAGSWSSLLPGVPSSLPDVKPMRGQLVQVDERPPRVRTIVTSARGYVVPRGDGRVICGSTMELAGFRREVTASGVAQILTQALVLVPSLADAQWSSAWSSFRPWASAPLVGTSPLPGLFLATGHHRNGILLARETGERVAEAVLRS